MQKNAFPYPTFLDSGNTAAEPLRDLFPPMKAYMATLLVSAFHCRQGDERGQEILSHPLPSTAKAVLAIAVLLEEP